MRMKEDMSYDYKVYSYQLQNQVLEVFHYTSKITDVKNLIDEIRKEANSLRKLLWTEEELKKRKEAVNLFDARMQATVYYTLKNIETYKEKGWKALNDEGENDYERNCSIEKKNS